MDLSSCIKKIELKMDQRPYSEMRNSETSTGKYMESTQRYKHKPSTVYTPTIPALRGGSRRAVSEPRGESEPQKRGSSRCLVVEKDVYLAWTGSCG